MLVYADRVKETASNKPDGSTAFNLPDTGATGYRSFDSVLATNDTCVYCAENGSAWEVGLGTFTAGSPDTLARTTLYASSTGSAIDFSSGGDVSVFITSDASQIRNAHLRSVAASPTTAGITGEVGVMHVLDISGLTANRDFTLPATCAVGDRVGVMLSTGDATYELLLKPATDDTINGGTASAEWSRLFITGEVVIFRCVTANAAWIVEYDGKVPQAANIVPGTSFTHTSSGAAVKVTWSDATVETNVGEVVDAANSQFIVRRAGKYLVTAIVDNSNAASGKATACYLYKNGALVGRFFFNVPGVTGTQSAGVTQVLSLEVDDYLEVYAFQSDSTSELINYQFGLAEIL